MPPAEIDPIEKKSYTKVWFLVGSIFFAVSVWAFYSEFIARRTWKGYQREFNYLELKKTQDEYDKAKQAIDTEDKRRDQLPDPVPPAPPLPDDQLSIRKIRLKIEAAEVAMDGKEYQDATVELKKRNIELSDAKQKLGFAKADEDEVFYEWKHSLLHENEKEAEEKKKRYYELEDRIAEDKKLVQEKEARVAEVQQILDKYQSELKKWKTAEKKYYEPLDKIQKRIEAIKDRSDDIKQVVIDDLGKGGPVAWGTVDRCESCHVAINRAGFENEKQPFRTHPFREEILGKHPPEQFGCTTCHWGQGRATQIVGKPLEEGDYAHGFVHHWETPLLKGDFTEASCNKCHQDQWKLDHADVAMKGKKLFWDLGCTGCHAIKGFESAPKVGPSLAKVKDKVYEEWLLSWIKDPKGYLPHTKMPKVPLDIDEPGQTEKVAAYILQSSAAYDFPFGKFPGGNAENGKKVFEAVGCYGCHTLGDKGTGLAPALDRITEKTSADWIYNWIQDPKAYNPDARMPKLRLTGQEAADVTAFLTQEDKRLPRDEALEQRLKDPENAKKGFLLISQYGCYGCHNIKGFEDASKLSVELTAFGRKDIAELDFGDTKIPRTWEEWTKGKIHDPRMYLTERTSSRMPNFGLSDEDIHSLVVFLKGLRKEDVPVRFVISQTRPHQKVIDDGRRMVERLNCKGCHLIEGEGRLIEQAIGPDKAPPNLMGIGARVRPDWMFAFLKDPSRIKIRPWIEVHMPTFGFTDDQTNAIVQYFSALDNVPPDFSTLPPKQPDPEMLAAGEKLASRDYFSCFSCHIQNGVNPPSAPEQWGPDLALAHERIRNGFIPEWVKDPQKFTPGVKMPAFLPADDAAPQDILGGNRQKQAEALRDYIMSLGATSSPKMPTTTPQ
ncbi:MAG TPA: c-type cytochrome [bacterium]|nr:c-type cytochrome [bacterium]